MAFVDARAGVKRLPGVVPPARSWPELLASPSTYLLFLGFVATVWAKLAAIAGLGAGGGIAEMVSSVAIDGTFAFGFAGLLALAEARRAWLGLTIPLALALSAAMIVNAWYLGITGEQLTWPAVELGLDRFGDVVAVALDALRRRSLAAVIVLLVIAGALPLAASRFARTTAQRSSHDRAHAATALALLFCLLALLPLRSDDLAIARLARSGMIDTWLGLLTGAQPPPDGALARDWFRGYDRSPILASAPDPATGPDVLLVIWESTRYDHTSLAGDGARAATPHLASLAERGAIVRTARAVVPHTTKSMFSMLCGRLPLLQQALLELSADVVPDCLPAAMRRAGWTTALFQSAVGTFEERPRLAAGLGFETFQAQEDIGGAKLGYLASDDESLAEPFSRWLDQIGEQRFFAVVLTSAPHHPYSLPLRVVDRVRASGAQANTPAHRYARLVEAQDHMLGELVHALRARGRADRTLIVVAGDHGEGFGEKGVSQHDNNFYEEGLRVPLVIAGPNVSRREIPGNASLVDVAPTIIGRLGVDPSAGLDGHDLFRTPPDGPRWFVCWYDQRCVGFVLGTRKTVISPEARTAFSFDLAADPDERRPTVPDPSLAAIRPALTRLLDQHRTPDWPVKLPEITIGAWRCPAGGRCALTAR